jgi:hypothetical protein
MLDLTKFESSTMKLYRAVPILGFVDKQRKVRHPGRRLPSNIPYLVDNLWEFTRPASKPSRRHAVYASPTVELALENASAAGFDRANYVVCELVFDEEPPLIQLSVKDARWHDDVANVQREVNSMLSRWVETDLTNKGELSALFLPGTSKRELMGAMEEQPELKEIVLEASKVVTLWEDEPSADGEFFLEVVEGNGYVLTKI